MFIKLNICLPTVKSNRKAEEMSANKVDFPAYASLLAPDKNPTSRAIFRVPGSSNGGWELLTFEPHIEGLPDKQIARFIDKRIYGQFAIFWPAGTQIINPDSESWTQPSLDGPNCPAKWRVASLDTNSGRVVLGKKSPSVPDGQWVNGYTYVLQPSADPEKFSALPSVCPCCAADYAMRQLRQSPLRGFRTGFSKMSQLLAKELFYCLPHGDQRKLVIFSDSREDAASISNGIERLHYRDLVREMMYDQLNASSSEAKFVEDTDSHGAPSSSAAVQFAAANPAWAAALKDLFAKTQTAGVEIDLIVRGICSLRPGVKELSEHIPVRSLVGRFLKHSRIFYFANGGDEEIYCGSADWMSRNLYERCEVVFPVKDLTLRSLLKNEILAACLADTAKTRILKPNGDYRMR